MNGRMKRAAQSIREARRSGALLDTLAPNHQPRSLEEGYAIQRTATAQWPDKIAGWKVGATFKEELILASSEQSKWYSPD
jgi:2-keto-4-pentenoate hydratase